MDAYLRKLFNIPLTLSHVAPKPDIRSDRGKKYKLTKTHSLSDDRDLDRVARGMGLMPLEDL